MTKPLSRRNLLKAVGVAGFGLPPGLLASAPKQRSGEGRTAYRMYATAGEMKRDASLAPGMLAQTAGYYFPGDGGAAAYQIPAPDGSVVPDGGSVIELEENRLAVLIPPAAVHYKMFGAAGDGEQDDGIAIKQAHEYANRLHIPVVNASGEYWIRGTYRIPVMTNVQWGHTVFHIDERFNTQNDPRFMVQDSEPGQEIRFDEPAKAAFLSKFRPGTQVIRELAPYKNCLLIVKDENDRIGFRAGARYKGQSWAREELVYVEEDGRILGEITTAFRDYTSLQAFPASDNYLVIEGGTFFLSGDSPGENERQYRSNGFLIRRSRTIIRNQWVGLEKGREDISLNPRRGFYSFSGVYDVTLENIRLTPWVHKRPGSGQVLQAGTYGIGGSRMLNATFRNLTAEGSLMHWGIFGTNLNKNFRIEGCHINRVDVHFYCWNLVIKDSAIGQRGITLTGGGGLLVENTSCDWNHFISFRNDFGAKWDGDIRIRNCRLRPADGDREAVVLKFTPPDFDYGYPLAYGRSILVEDFIIDYREVPASKLPCWLMKTAIFSKTKGGERLAFPRQVTFRNIAVEGREQGVRLMEIPSPYSYFIRQRGSYDGAELKANTALLFGHIQLEKLPSSAVHISLGNRKGEDYEDDHALYPDIRFEDCRDLAGDFGDSAARLTFTRCSITHLTACGKHEGGDTGLPVSNSRQPVAGLLPGRAGLSFTDCRFRPETASREQPFYELFAGLGVSFTNCIIHIPGLNGIPAPALLDRFGFVQLNKTVRYNHLNTRLGNDVLRYCKDLGIELLPAFIAMLKCHHELEPESIET